MAKKINKNSARPVAEKNQNNGQKNKKISLPTQCGMGEVKKIFGDMEVAKSLPPCGRLIVHKDEVFLVDRKSTYKNYRAAADAVRSGLDKVVSHLIKHRVPLCPRCRRTLFRGAGVRTLSLATLEAWRKKARERDARELRETIQRLSAASRGGQSLGDLLREAGIAPPPQDEAEETPASASLPTPPEAVVGKKDSSPRKGKNKKTFLKDEEGTPARRRERSPKGPKAPKGNKGNLRKALLG